MKEVAEMKRPFSTHDMCNAIQEFVNDNRHSRDVEVRWYCEWLSENVLPTARIMRSGSALGPLERKLAAEFRLKEIADERGKRQADIERLENEARTIRAATA